MSDRLLAPVAAAVALLVVAALSVFIVGEDEFAVRTRFGQVQQADYAPGLHWCWPFERIERVDRRVLGSRMPAESLLDDTQQGLSVDIDMSWRVRDVTTYLHGGSGASAEAAVATNLADALRGRLKAAYAQMSLPQILSATRGGVSDELIAQLAPVAAAQGVEMVDVRVKRIDPTDQVAGGIYARMQEAYAAQARELRAEGTATADRIRAEADRNQAEIVAAATRDAQRVRGEGDAQAAAIYARAYGANPEFAAFYRSLQAYRNALGRDGDILVVQPDGEFYKYLHSPARR